MGHLFPTEEQFAALRNHSHSGPIWMLNLLRFKEEGGKESYQTYGEKVRPLVEKRGGSILYRSEGRYTVIGPDAWDEALLIMYPSRDAFFDMIESDEYQAIVHFRQDAIVDSRLYMTTELSLP